MGLHIAYTANDKEVIDGWIVEVKEAFPDFEVDAHPLSLSVSLPHRTWRTGNCMWKKICKFPEKYY